MQMKNEIKINCLYCKDIFIMKNKRNFYCCKSCYNNYNTQQRKKQRELRMFFKIKYKKCSNPECNIIIKNSKKQEKKFCSQNCYHKINFLKGRSWEEIYGVEGAKKFREKRSITRTGKKLNRIKPSFKKGKTAEEIYGKEKAKQIDKKILETKIKNNYIWTRDKIIKRYLSIPNIRRDQWNYYRKKGILCDMNTLFKLFGNFKKLQEKTEKYFLPVLDRPEWLLGRNEKFILNDIEKNNNIKLERLYKICVNNKKYYFIDGYDKINNVAYEVDEHHHKNKINKIKDLMREEEIKNILNCKFIRIDEEEYLKKFKKEEEIQCLLNY